MSLMGRCIASIARNTLRGGCVFKLKQYLVAIRGQIKPCEAQLDVIGEIRAAMQEHFEKSGDKIR